MLGYFHSYYLVVIAMRIVVAVLLFIGAGCSVGWCDDVDFRRHIQPLIESSCLSCHHVANAEGDLRLDTRAAMIKGGENGAALVVGKPKESPLYLLAIAAADADNRMPPEGPMLATTQTEMLAQWIADGADWPSDVVLKVKPRIEFVKHVQPILEMNCVACHQTSNAEGELSLTTYASAMKGGASGKAIVPYDSDKSSIVQLIMLSKDDDQLMPPSDKGGPLAAKEIAALKMWVEQGAVWPQDVSLKPRAKIDLLTYDTPDDFKLVQKIHSQIVAKAKADADAEFKSYDAKVPATGAAFSMVSIPAGQFLMGSPADEADRTEAEGPQTKVKVSAFWIGKHEVTWDEYEPFMITQVDRHKHGARVDYDSKKHTLIDAISQPTKPYMEMSFGMGQKGYPAISMTQHAANKYCQWLSAQTGKFYRLPTEAEWEYACRAGTTTAWSFGDNAAELGQYAWYYDNANEKYQKVGMKKPNPWGLYDMHGNVMEWTTDAYSPDYFEKIANQTENPFLKPDRLYPRTVRGGGWDDDPEQTRSAFRRGSAPEWKQQDPQLPKSVWYHTNARWLGFRIVQPLKIPTAEEMYFFWNSAANKL